MDIHQLGWKQFHEHKRTGLLRRRFLWFWGDVWLEVRRLTSHAADRLRGPDYRRNS